MFPDRFKVIKVYRVNMVWSGLLTLRDDDRNG